MAAIWPAYAAIKADGYGLAQDSDVRRTQWEDGMVRQERKFSGALRVRGITALLADDAALVKFRAWAATHAHTWFDWVDIEDGRTRRGRVRGGSGAISYRAREAGGALNWEATLEIEGLE